MTANATRQLDRTLFTHNITHEEFLDVLLAVAIFAVGREGAGDGDEIVWGLPVLVHGEPGNGKSTITNKIGRTWMDLTHLHMLSQHPAEDLGGYAVPNKTRTAIEQIPAQFVEQLNAAPSSLLILDEFGSVDQAKHAAAQSVITERRAGATRLKGHVRMLAIANPPEVSTNGEPLSMPSANRFFHMPFISADVDSFKGWLISAGKLTHAIEKKNREAHEAAVLKAWPSAYAMEVAVVCGYLDRFKADLHCMPRDYGVDADAGEQDELRWASHRVWEMLTRALASARIHGLSVTQIDFIVRSLMPAGIASRFLAYRTDQDIPTPESVLDDPESFKITARLDKTIAVLNMTVSFLTGDVENRLDRAANWWVLADRVIASKHGGADLVTGPARTMALPTSRDGCGLGQEVVPSAATAIQKLYGVLAVGKKTEQAVKAGK